MNTYIDRNKNPIIKFNDIKEPLQKEIELISPSNGFISKGFGLDYEGFTLRKGFFDYPSLKRESLEEMDISKRIPFVSVIGKSTGIEIFMAIRTLPCSYSMLNQFYLYLTFPME